MLPENEQLIGNAIAPDKHRAVEACAEKVRALAHEIETAIAAIKTNQLPQLRASIARQEMLCAELAAGANRQQLVRRGLKGEAQLELEREIAELGTLLPTYRALLQRCVKNNALLLALYRSYGGIYIPLYAPAGFGRRLSTRFDSCL